MRSIIAFALGAAIAFAAVAHQQNPDCRKHGADQSQETSHVHGC